MTKSSILALIMVLAFGLQAQDSAPENWFHLGPNDGYNGVNTIEAYKKLKDRKSKTVVVAVIDSGVDCEHEDLDGVMWVNHDEIPNNGKDDDNNGYVDDMHGWNFLGGPDGKNVDADTYEVTRVYKKLHQKYDNMAKTDVKKKDKEEFALYQKVAKEVKESQAKAEENLENINGQVTFVENVLNSVDSAMKSQKLGFDQIDSLQFGENAELAANLQVFKSIRSQMGDEVESVDQMKDMMNEQFEGAVNYYSNKANYAYNTDFNPRTIIGDDYNNVDEVGYGNNDYEGPDAFHGTHVSGIIAAERGNGMGMDGVADNVRIMTLRAVPNGDERDKDVANAIRYAVDNGAEVINMSFGKGYAWDKNAVDAAVKYAMKNDVLLVHAAGNSATENTNNNNFPNDDFMKKGFLFFGKKNGSPNWIEVGALSYKKDESLPATFSNYSGQNVDVFSPGVEIYSTIPDSKYQNAQGTSMASPVTAGVATILRSYFPELSAAQVKDIIMQTVRPVEQKVTLPGGDELVSFKDLCVTGGMVDAKAAVELALKTEGKRKKAKAYDKKEVYSNPTIKVMEKEMQRS